MQGIHFVDLETFLVYILCVFVYVFFTLVHQFIHKYYVSVFVTTVCMTYTRFRCRVWELALLSILLCIDMYICNSFYVITLHLPKIFIVSYLPLPFCSQVLYTYNITWSRYSPTGTKCRLFFSIDKTFINLIFRQNTLVFKWALWLRYHHLTVGVWETHGKEKICLNF